MSVPYRQIRATFDSDTIVVYQAYNSAIADAAVKAQTFVAPFSFNRATWIKPSFLWLMERSGYASKSNQERILGVHLTRKGWEQALSSAVLSHPDEQTYRSGEEWEEKMKTAPVIVQWDPERSLRGEKLEHRSIQVGLRRTIVKHFVEWVVKIEDLTPLTKKLAKLRQQREYSKARRLLPVERVYPVGERLAEQLGMS